VEAAKARRQQGYRMVVTVNDIDLAALGFRVGAEAFNATVRGGAIG
jgi:hypothetical protein